MNPYLHANLADHVIALEYDSRAVRHHAENAVFLSWLAEFDERRLYEAAGYTSMRQYCVERSRMSEPIANNYIRVARAGRSFPAIFPALAEGRLHMCGVILLASRLTPENANELLDSAAWKSKLEIERMLKDLDAPPARPAFPMPTVASDDTCPTSFVPVPDAQVFPGTPVPSATSPSAEVKEPPSLRGRVTPLSHGYSELLATLDDEATRALEDARALLGHSLPTGSIPLVIKRALVLLTRQLRRRKFAQVDKPRAPKSTARGRRIPAHVRRAVAERDGETCAFVSADGHRCNSRERVEFDHITPVAMDGQSTVDNVRLHCRTHNQYRAKQKLGAGFMQERIRAAQERAADKKAEKASAARAAAAEAELIPVLLHLGYNKPLAKRGAAVCASMPGASLDQRLRAALKELAVPAVRIPAPAQAAQCVGGAG